MALLGRDTAVTGPFKTGTLLLETFHGREALGAAYRYDLTLLSEDANIPVDKVLGHSLTVHLKLDTGATRYFNGVVTYFAKVGLSMHHTRYAAVLHPKLTLFDYTRDCRIFNDPSNFDPDPEGKAPTQNALKIVLQVLADRGFTDVESGKVEAHAFRDRRYCVQYRETDLNFLQRLLEDEGIYYYFTHDNGKHTLVLADSATAHAKVKDYEEVMYLPKQQRQSRDKEHFWSMSVAGALRPGNYTVVRGYDPTKLRAKQAQVESQSSGVSLPGTSFEDYDYPGGLSESPEAKDEAIYRMQSDQAANTFIEVEGNTMGLGTGNLVKLHKPDNAADYHPFWADADFGKEYLITSATYSISINQLESGDAVDADEPFKATYTLLDIGTPFRLPRTAPKPRIEGPQTAIVVGSTGDEIYTDKLGRVKVQFDWDRLSERNQKSSCWVRVAHVWAGKQWGAMHIPRVGQEVIVEFLDGDPDRPIITGRVYNADNMPPYGLPDNKTQSGIKSRSTKNGTANNFNEIRFEDLKGKEELHIQAERNMSTLVKADQSTSVGGDRTVSVHGNLSTTVDGSGGRGDYQSTHSVTGKHNLHASQEIKADAPDKIELCCQGSSITLEPNKITIRAGGEAAIVLDANLLAYAKEGAVLKLDANVSLRANGGGGLAMDENAMLTANDGSKVLLGSGALVASNEGSKLMLTSSALLDGKSTATVNAGVEAALTAGGSVKANKAGVEATGTMIKMNS